MLCNIALSKSSLSRVIQVAVACADARLLLLMRGGLRPWASGLGGAWNASPGPSAVARSPRGLTTPHGRQAAGRRQLPCFYGARERRGMAS